MASSGIKLDDSIAQTATDFKKKRNYGFVLVLNDANNKVVLKEDSVLQNLPVIPWIVKHAEDKNVCYFIAHYVFKSKETGSSNDETIRKKDEFVMVTWAPDTAPVKKKMLAASTKEAVKRGLEKYQISNIKLISISAKEDLDVKGLTEGLKDCKSVIDFDVHHDGEEKSCD